MSAMARDPHDPHAGHDAHGLGADRHAGGHAHGAEADDGQDLHDDHGEPPPPEPASPAWLPLLGLALFGAAFLLFLIWTADGDPNAGTTNAAAPEAANAAPADARAEPQRAERGARAMPTPVPGVTAAASGRFPIGQGTAQRVPLTAPSRLRELLPTRPPGDAARPAGSARPLRPSQPSAPAAP